MLCSVSEQVWFTHLVYIIYQLWLFLLVLLHCLHSHGVFILILCVDDIGETIKYLHTFSSCVCRPTGCYVNSRLYIRFTLNRYSFGHILVYSIVCCLIPIICATLIDCCEKNVLGKYIDGGRKTNSLELKRWHLFGIMVCFIVGCIVILYISGNNFINSYWGKYIKLGQFHKPGAR